MPARKLYPGGCGGAVEARSTETVLPIVTRDAAELGAALAEAVQSEQGHGHALARAWSVRDVRLRDGSAPGPAFVRATLNRRPRGRGQQVVLSTLPLPGWTAETVSVLATLEDYLPAGGTP